VKKANLIVPIKSVFEKTEFEVLSKEDWNIFETLESFCGAKNVIVLWRSVLKLKRSLVRIHYYTFKLHK